jgi:hypothetical protein
LVQFLEYQPLRDLRINELTEDGAAVFGEDLIQPRSTLICHANFRVLLEHRDRPMQASFVLPMEL